MNEWDGNDSRVETEHKRSDTDTEVFFRKFRQNIYPSGRAASAENHSKTCPGKDSGKQWNENHIILQRDFGHRVKLEYSEGNREWNDADQAVNEHPAPEQPVANKEKGDI